MKTIELHLAGSSTGRIILHFVCMARDGRLHWHLKGIAREFGGHAAFR